MTIEKTFLKEIQGQLRKDAYKEQMHILLRRPSTTLKELFPYPGDDNSRKQRQRLRAALMYQGMNFLGKNYPLSCAPLKNRADMEPSNDANMFAQYLIRLVGLRTWLSPKTLLEASTNLQFVYKDPMNTMGAVKEVMGTFIPFEWSYVYCENLKAMSVLYPKEASSLWCTLIRLASTNKVFMDLKEIQTDGIEGKWRYMFTNSEALLHQNSAYFLRPLVHGISFKSAAESISGTISKTNDPWIARALGVAIAETGKYGRHVYDSVLLHPIAEDKPHFILDFAMHLLYYGNINVAAEDLLRSFNEGSQLRYYNMTMLDGMLRFGLSHGGRYRIAEELMKEIIFRMDVLSRNKIDSEASRCANNILYTLSKHYKNGIKN